MENSGKIILGVLGAVAAGIAIGMLMAPDKGSETRKKIGEKATDLASRVGDLVTTGKEKITDLASNLTKQADGAINEAGKRADRVKESMA